MAHVRSYQRYFEKHPPLHLMVAAYLGIKPEEKKTAEDLFEVLSGINSPNGFGAG